MLEKLSPAVLSPRKRFLLALLASVLIIPVDMLASIGPSFAAPLSLLFLPSAALSLLKSRSVEAMGLLIAVFVSCITVFAVAPFAKDFSLTPLASLLFFFAPASFYFLGREKVKSVHELIYFLRASLWAAVVLVFSLFCSIFIFGDGVVRTDGVMNGSFFSFTLSGSYGIHSLAAHFFLIGAVVVYYVQSGFASKLEKALSLVVLAFLMYMMIFSLSREIVLALSFVGVVTLFRRFTVLQASAFLIATGIMLYAFGGALVSPDSAWATRILQTTAADNLNDLTSGRIELQILAIRQIFQSPLTGTGFHGYTLNYLSSESYDDLSGWSTHIYYLTTVWKMGVVAAFFYFCFLYQSVSGSLRSSSRNFSNATGFYLTTLIAFLFLVNMAWDALLSTNVMGLFAFFLGATTLQGRTLVAGTRQTSAPDAYT